LDLTYANKDLLPQQHCPPYPHSMPPAAINVRTIAWWTGPGKVFLCALSHGYQAGWSIGVRSVADWAGQSECCIIYLPLLFLFPSPLPAKLWSTWLGGGGQPMLPMLSSSV
jgi:hypothetical protein